MSVSQLSSSMISRRAVVGTSLAGGAMLPLVTLGAAPPRATAGTPSYRQEAASELARWKTWLIDAPDSLRPDAPGTPTAAEIDEILGLLEAPSDEMTAAITRWGTAPATIPWTAATNAAFGEFRVSGLHQSRNLALVHTAMHDAAVAAWDAQLAHNRPSPAATDDRIVPVAGTDPAAPTFPSEHAAIAGAVASLLTYLLPDAAPGRFDELAEEAAMSRVWAGAAFPSDVEAGLALGRAVGERAVEYDQGNETGETFDAASMPSGPGTWEPTPPAFADPLEPLGAFWQTWILERGDQIRPLPPSEYDSPSWRSEMQAVQQIVQERSLSQQTDAVWWQQTAAHQTFYDWTNTLLASHGVDTPHAARILAYQSVSMADAVVAVWDAKYTWWTSRPITEDPEIITSFPTPPYPSYPSGYSAAVGATTQSVGLFFPEAAEQLDELCWRAVRSRAWAGIHYPIDNEVGMCMGRQVARLAAVRAMEEGAIPY